MNAGKSDLIRQMRQGNREALGKLLDLYAACLRRTAASQLPARVQGRMGASDLVQETCLDAHRDFARFDGATEKEFLAWLHGILQHNIHGAIRDQMQTQKRAARLERSLNDSSVGSLGDEALAADQSSPSGHVAAAEEVLKLAKALERLPFDQREAVRLRHLFGWPLDKMAEHFGRSHAATAGLVKRGVAALREILCEEPDESLA
jgi:RNA polymerase sigma-70 factor, ECF subfamily